MGPGEYFVHCAPGSPSLNVVWTIAATQVCIKRVVFQHILPAGILNILCIIISWIILCVILFSKHVCDVKAYEHC
jgi:hypothetical protein